MAARDCAVWFLLVFVFCTLPAVALPHSLTIIGKAGFQSRYKPYSRFPVEIKINNQGPETEAILRITVVSHLVDSVWTNEQKIVLKPGPNTFHTAAQSHRDGIALRASVEVSHNLRAATTVFTNEYAQGSSVVAAFGEPEHTIGSLYCSKYPFNGLRQDHYNGVLTVDAVQVGKSSSLEKFKPGTLSSLDAVFLIGFSPHKVKPAALETLEGYVLSGGVVIISGITDHNLFDNPFYRRLLPGRAVGKSGLHTAIGKPVDSSVFIANKDSEEHLLTQNVRFWTREYGRGVICYLPFDLGSTAFQRRSDYPTILCDILSITSTYQKKPVNVDMLHQQTVYQELAGILPKNAPSLPLVGLLLLCYVIAIAPLNYYIQKRHRSKGYGWKTLIATASVFTLFACLFSFAIRAEPYTLNQVVVSDYTSGSNVSRHVIAGFSSNRAGNYTLHGPPNGYFMVSIPTTEDSIIPTPLISSGGMTTTETYQTIRAKQWTPQITRFSFLDQGKAPITGTVSLIDNSITGSLTNHLDREWDEVWVIVDGRTFRLKGNFDTKEIQFKDVGPKPAICPPELIREDASHYRLKTAVHNFLPAFPYGQGVYVVAFDDEATPVLGIKPEPDAVLAVEAVICRLARTPQMTGQVVLLPFSVYPGEGFNIDGQPLTYSPDYGLPMPGEPHPEYFTSPAPVKKLVTDDTHGTVEFDIMGRDLAKSGLARRLSVRISGEGDFQKSRIEVKEERSGNFRLLSLSGPGGNEIEIPPHIHNQRDITLRMKIPPNSVVYTPSLKVEY